ncbi:LysM peptidoglycan-binding domain-containing protein [Cellulomonas sp. C5510]|uniref:LysM peptidoglycan-binding domain-containing protein n=1 Tax=Cellulomonas sp. C5510 TaxID=2871170 RepID=UPI001C984B79|nr:LysM peptidoglycan-binding domain-containing protein [Cellulomonas sp. C5510]QZN84912.1 LysM peptidoglycan-binding domain-containing protein [Cellulomonas sp. C5510]
MKQAVENRVHDAARRRGIDVIRGLLATVGIAGFVIGVPIALAAVAPIRVPSSVPSFGGIIDALSRPDDGDLLIGTLTVIAWLAWAAFAVPLVVELIASLRGVRTPRLPLLGPAQRIAAGLVATAGLLMTAPVASASAASAGDATAVSAMTRVHLQDADRAQAPGSSSSDAEGVDPAQPASVTATTTLPAVTVVRGDTLWDLAERHLGSGHRYTEIRDLNLGRAQLDGRALTDAHWIYPGWHLLLPADAVDVAAQPVLPPAPSEAPERAAADYTVAPGDTLWDISAEQLGDPLRYPEIVELNRGRPQPDGGTLQDPDLIRPGWTLRLPDAVASSAGPSPEKRDDAQVGPDDAPPLADDAELGTALPETPSDDTPANPHDAARLDDDGSRAADDATGGRHVAEPPEEQVPAEDGNPAEVLDAHDDDADLGQRFVLGLTSLAAAGVVGELARRRRLQQRARQVGRRITLPEEGSPAHRAERTLRTAEPPLTIAALKLAFSHLATRCYESERDLPRVAAVVVTPDEVTLHLSDDDDAPVTPFTATGARTWSTPHRALASMQIADDPGRPEPFPALVTLGHSTDGTLLLNLEAAGTLTIGGDPAVAADIRRALVAELVTSDLTGRIGLVAGPDFEPLARACDPARLQTAAASAITRTADRRLSDVRDALEAAGLDDTLQARSDRLMEDVWLPVVFDSPDAPKWHPGPWTGTVVVRLDATSETGWTVTADEAGARIEPLGLHVRPQRLNAEGLRRLVGLLALAPPVDDAQLQRPTPLTVEILDAAAALPPTEEADETSEAPRPTVRVELLGPVLITGLPDQAGHLSRRSTELLVYLALRGRATGPELDEALWYGERIDSQTRNSLVYRTRQRVGADVLPVVGADGIYRLGDMVTTDWADFQKHARQGLAAGIEGMDELRVAMNLVRDRPLLGVRDADYSWAEHDVQHMISTVVDIAHVLSRLLLGSGDVRGSLEAATRGLMVDACSSLLLDDALEAAEAGSDDATTDRLRRRLLDDMGQQDVLIPQRRP